MVCLLWVEVNSFAEVSHSFVVFFEPRMNIAPTVIIVRVLWVEVDGFAEVSHSLVVFGQPGIRFTPIVVVDSLLVEVDGFGEDCMKIVPIMIVGLGYRFSQFLAVEMFAN